jgi:hypothetical protein
MKKLYVLLSCILLSTQIMAWNAVGHHIIAQIAYDNLDANTKHLLQKYNAAVNKTQRYKDNLITAASWLDRLYGKEFSSVKSMHYINLAFSDEALPLPHPQQNNAVWAINMANNYLHDSNTSLLDKGIALRVLLHVVGDLHQPLHAANQISTAHPEGDRGGNLFVLQKNNVAPSLHAYWDRGGGLWMARGGFSAKKIKAIAKRLEKIYPCKENDLNPMHWAQESHKIGVNIGYHALPKDGKPDFAYQKNVQEIAQYRVAQAGCRLAMVIKK